MTTQDILDLAPRPPRMPLGARYRGDGHDLTLADLDAQDRRRVTLIYESLQRVYLAWKTDPGQPDWATVAEACDELTTAAMEEAASEFGGDLDPDIPANAHLLSVVHDIRGGGLSAAMAEAEMLQMAAPNRESRHRETRTLQSLVYLSRDQAKMMRNAVVDLDPEGRAEDEAERPHLISWLIERWDGHAYPIGNRSTQVNASADEDGALSSCCLEASAVDRVVYNYISNAARFSADGKVEMQIHHVAQDIVRVVVANALADDQAAWLEQTLARDPGALFRTGVTRGGEGRGLANAAYFVNAAFGHQGVEAGLESGLLGGVVQHGEYRAWFHWPVLVAAKAG